MQLPSRALSAIRDVARRKLRMVLSTALVAAVLAPPLAPVEAQTPKRGGTLTIGTEADPPSIDPLRVGSYVERQFAMAILEPLFDLNEKGEIVPFLVETYEVTPDAKHYTLRLRRSIKFHDGTPFNAEAVKFNIDRVRDPANGCRCLALVADIESVTVKDELTVAIALKKPSAVLPAALSDAPGLMGSPTALKANPTRFGNHPIGTGPFKLVEWTKGARFVADRNPDYWREGRPYVDRLVFRGLQNDETRQATMLSGALDIMLYPSPKFVAQARKDKRYVVLEPKGLGSGFIAMNQSKEPTSDLRVRQAIAHATDRKLLLKAVYHNVYPEAHSPFAAGLAAHEMLDDYPKYDPEKAKKLLAEYGKPVSVKLQGDNTPVTILALQAVQEMWRTVGIKVELTPVDQARSIQNMLTKQFETALFRWTGRPDPDLNTYRFFHSRFAYGDKPSANYTNYANPEMDKLLDTGQAALDPLKRIDIYRNVTRLLAKDLPYVFLYHTAFPQVVTRKVHGVRAIPDCIVRVGDVWIE